MFVLIELDHIGLLLACHHHSSTRLPFQSAPYFQSFQFLLGHVLEWLLEVLLAERKLADGPNLRVLRTGLAPPDPQLR